MRQFKFRVWNIEENKWNDPVILEVFGASGELESLYNPQENYVIQQFTGLLDKNGKEIYEGDSLKFQWGEGLSTVRWAFEYEDNYPGFRIWDLMGQGGEMEIAGNIFENPELLK